MEEKKKSLEEEMFTETDITDPLLDEIYKRYKVTTFELKESVEEIKEEADRLLSEFSSRGSIVIGDKVTRS